MRALTQSRHKTLSLQSRHEGLHWNAYLLLHSVGIALAIVHADSNHDQCEIPHLHFNCLIRLCTSVSTAKQKHKDRTKSRAIIMLLG